MPNRGTTDRYLGLGFVRARSAPVEFPARCAHLALPLNSDVYLVPIGNPGPPPRSRQWSQGISHRPRPLRLTWLPVRPGADDASAPTKYLFG